MEELKTYLEMRIRECNWELEKNYQDGTDIIRMARLEERVKTLTEVQLFVNRKIPEANKRKKLNEKIKKMENAARKIDGENKEAVLEASEEATKEAVDWIMSEIKRERV